MEAKTDDQSLLNELLDPIQDINSAPKDHWNMAYSVYFLMGIGLLLPRTALTTAVDYFSYIYPSAHVARVFTLSATTATLAVLGILLAGGARRSSIVFRVNLGWWLFLLSLSAVLMVDVLYVQGKRGVYGGYYLTVGVAALCGVAQALVQGSIFGFAGKLPSRFMQGVVAGTSGSGVLVSIMRIVSKAMYPKDFHGLRSSAIFYFGTSIVVILACFVSYNLASNFPIMQYYQSPKFEAITKIKGINQQTSKTIWKMNKQIWWIGSGLFLTLTISYSIYPGPISEDVHSDILEDWYPIILTTCFNVFDLVGKSLSAFYVVENVNVVIFGTFSRLLFYPMFLICLDGPEFFQTEVPVMLLASLLGLTNGYCQSILVILSPKFVGIEHMEGTGVWMVSFLVLRVFIGTVFHGHGSFESDPSNCSLPR